MTLQLPLHADLVIFDIDGTLVDAFEMISRSFNAAMRALGLPERGFAEVKRMVGTGSRQLLAPVVPEASLDRALDAFYAEYEQRFLAESHAMPGALELLGDLEAKGIKLATASNKRGIHCRKGLDQLGILRHLQACLGAGDVEHLKPDPEMICEILKRLDCAPERALMVGDSPIDIATALAAGLRCVCVATGSHSEAELEDAGADLVLGSLHPLRAGILRCRG